MTTAISFQNVTKDYATSKGIVRALRGLDLEIPQGVIYGLLGPNGAGKTTALEIAVGLREATGGLARTMGLTRSGKTPRSGTGSASSRRTPPDSTC